MVAEQIKCNELKIVDFGDFRRNQIIADFFLFFFKAKIKQWNISTFLNIFLRLFIIETFS